MPSAFDLGPVPERVIVETEQVRRLVSDQLPQWASLPIMSVADGGWDNWTFRLGTDMLVRLPSAAEYAEAVVKEQRWLPLLAPNLPMPVPQVLARGVPGAGYPFSWSVYRWLEGQTMSVDLPTDLVDLAVDLADFLTALRGVTALGGPQPGIHNWFRGGPLQTYDGVTGRALAALSGHLDVDAVAQVWAASLSASWDGVDRWFHGDVARGNLLVRDGRLAAIIDFGTCGVGDPACDLAAAWTLLTADARQVFRDKLAVDDASWERGRGWALWKTLVTCSYTYEDPEDANEYAEARRVLAEIVG